MPDLKSTPVTFSALIQSQATRPGFIHEMSSRRQGAASFCAMSQSASCASLSVTTMARHGMVREPDVSAM